jgi:hypothetical protein
MGESYYKENDCMKYTYQLSSQVGYVELEGST